MSVTIGGSQAAAAVGLDPFKSQVQLWAELTGKLEPREAGEAALWGTLLEPVVREQVKERGYDVDAPTPNVTFTPKHGFVDGHIDGFVRRAMTPTMKASSDFVEWENPRGIYEGKTCGPWIKGWDDGAAPPAYVIQTHHYMILTGLQWSLLACLVAGQTLELREIERDEALCQLIIEQEGEFVRYCETDTPPPPDGSPATTEVLKRLYKATSGEIINLTAADADKVNELRKVKAARKAAETQEAQLENELKVRLGEAVYGMYEGQKAVSWSPITSNRFDTKLCKEEAPELYERFVRESTYRRFMLHGK